MIQTAKVYQRTTQMLKSGTSGYQNDVEFTSDMESTFIHILNKLCDNYESNSEISDLLNKEGLIKSPETATSLTGTFEFPEDHYRTFNIMVVGLLKNFPAYKIATNEVAMHETSPIRGFGDDTYGYYLTDGKFQMLPRASMIVIPTYCIKPAMPVLELTNDGNDYEIIGPDTTNIKLPENLFNLFCYEMMERAGVEMKEQLIMEYSQLGINKE